MAGQFTVPDSDRIAAPGIELVPLPEKPKTPPAQTPAQARKDELDVQKLERDLSGKGTLTSEDRGKFQRQMQGALGLKKRISEIEQLYTDSFRGAGGDQVASDGTRTQTSPGLGSAAEYLPGRVPIIGRPVNEVFKNAGGSLMGDLAAAYGLTAQQQNTPVELEIRFGPFIPKAGDPDEVIERKIRRLKEVAEEQERQATDALGVKDDKHIDAPLPAKSIDMGVGSPQDDAPPPLGTNPISGGGDGETGPSLGLSGGQTRSVIDPKKQALGSRIAALVGKGADRNTIMGFAVGADPTLRGDPTFRGWVDDALKYRKQHPGAKFPVDPSFYTSEVPLSSKGLLGSEFLSEKDRAEAASSGIGAALMNAGDAVTAGNMGNLTGDEEAVDRALALSNAQHPGASLTGSVVGGGSAALGGEAALARLGMAPGLLRAALADTAYGGTTGATNAPEGQGVTGAAKGAAYGLGGSLGGNMLGRLSGSVTRGVTNPTVGYVAKEVPLTIGQAVGQSGVVGRAVKKVEDSLSGIPVVGDAINARRLEGLQKMNAKAFDRALEPVGAKVGGKFGEEAVQEAQDQVSGAFQKALGGKQATVDHGFIADAEKGKMAIDALPTRVRDEVRDSVDDAINNYFVSTPSAAAGLKGAPPINEEQADLTRRLYEHLTGEKLPDGYTPSMDEMLGASREGLRKSGGFRAEPRPDPTAAKPSGDMQISGENMQALLQELNGIKRAYRGDPLGHRIGKAIDQVTDSIENLFRRQAPDVMPQYDAAKKAFKRVSTLEDAVLKGKQTGGVFTSAQLGMADRANTIKYGGKHTAAAGGGEFHDFQRNMQDVLPSKVPDSGTAGRLIVPAAIVGAGTGAGYASGDAGTGLTLSALLALAYSRAGQRMLTGAALKRGNAARTAGKAIQKAAPLIGHGAASQAALGD